ncbi:MAG: hypothetical protein ACXW4T_02390 [Candidatus Limnocylindrales bacterium]
MLPVKGSGRDLGTQIRMVDGPDGRLWISIPESGRAILVLLDSTGKPSAGWPIVLPGVEACDQLLAADDSTVRVICNVRPSPGGPYDAVVRAFAFDANAGSMPGWPVDIEDGSIGRVVGDELIMLVDPLWHEGGKSGERWPVTMIAIAADGTRRTGIEVPFLCCDTTRALGPDGIAYGMTRRDWATASSIKSDVMAFGLNGARQGWPVTIDGNASDLAFDASGLAYAVVGAPDGRTTGTVVLGRDGHQLPAGSAGHAIVSTATWNGAGDFSPGAPIVADDGTVYIVSTSGGSTTVVGLDPAGQPLIGWPYSSKLGMQWKSHCRDGETGCGQSRTAPAIGPNNALYLLNAASGSSTGGSMVAIAADGRIRSGWPIGLRRSGAMFWSMVVAPDGLSWALAIEPEEQEYSATVLAIAEDSTVLSATTIVEP